MADDYRILLARRAVQDLEVVLDGIRSRTNRPRVARLILDQVRTLATSPHRHPAVTRAASSAGARSGASSGDITRDDTNKRGDDIGARDAEPSGLRAMTVAWWVVFFQVSDSTREVRVLRVRHRCGRSWFRRWLGDVLRRERRSVSEAGRLNRVLLQVMAQDAAELGPRSDADELCDAAIAGRVADVKHWLARGLPADVENRHERTPLSLADDLPVIRALLEAGADASDPDLLIGWTDAACDRMHQLSLAGPDPDDLEILRLLLAHGADLAARGAQGYTALDLPAGYGCEPVIRFLEAAAADAGQSSCIRHRPRARRFPSRRGRPR